MPSLYGGGFSDFISMTAPKIWSDKDKFTNNLQRTGGYILPRLLMGREGGASVAGGERIREYLLTRPNQTFRFHGPNDPTPGWTLANHSDKTEVPYRFAEAYTGYTAQETELNEGDMALCWKRVRDAKLGALWTAVAEGVENSLAAQPDNANMETFAANPGKPYSIFAGVNEQTGGRFGTVTTATGALGETPWAADGAIQGLARTTSNNWQCAQQSYGVVASAGWDVTSLNNIAVAFSNMWRKVQFKSPGIHTKYFEDAANFRQVIFASNDGCSKFEHVLRRSNNTLPMMQDPAYSSSQYHGIPIEYWPALDSATLYSAVGATTTCGTEATADITGPRYYWLNFNHVRVFWHPSFYMKLLDQFHPENQRTTTIIPVETWFNLFFNSLRHQGIVYPITADQ